MSTTRTRRFSKAAFFKSVGYEPHPGQLEIHNSKAPRRVVACGVRWGKTMCAAMESLAAAMEPRERCVGWCVAPTYELSERVFNQIVMTAASHLRHRIVTLREHDRKLVLRNMGGGLSEIRGKTADNPTSLLGEGLDFLVMDEASRLKPSIWESHLSQRLIDRKGWALLISTPRGKGYFYDLWRRGQPGGDPEFESWNQASSKNPLLDAAAIEEERERLPDRVFQQEYMASFLEGNGSVFSNVRDLATVEWQAPDPNEWYVAGLDLAKISDYSVLIIMNSKWEVVFVDRFNRMDWNTQVARIRGHCDRYKHARVLVDSTGAGEPVFESLRYNGLYADEYPLTARSKADLINNLVLRMEQRSIKLPRADLCPELIEELEAFQYSVTDQGNIKSGAPHGVHDDMVIALALAVWHLRRLPQPFLFRDLTDADLRRMGVIRVRHF